MTNALAQAYDTLAPAVPRARLLVADRARWGALGPATAGTESETVRRFLDSRCNGWAECAAWLATEPRADGLLSLLVPAASCHVRLPCTVPLEAADGAAGTWTLRPGSSCAQLELRQLVLSVQPPRGGCYVAACTAIEAAASASLWSYRHVAYGHMDM